MWVNMGGKLPHPEEVPPQKTVQVQWSALELL